MAKYDFKCNDCGKMNEDMFLSINHEKTDRPLCCGKHVEVYFSQAPMMHYKDYELPNGGYRSISTKDRAVITSRKQEREYLKKNGLIHAQELGPPPTAGQEAKVRAEADAAIAKIDGRSLGLEKQVRQMTEQMK